MAQRFYYRALITLPSSVNSYSKRLFIALPQVFIAVNGEVCLHNAMIQGKMFLLIRSVGDVLFLLHCWTPQLNVCFYSAAPAWQASKGVEERKERKKSGKFQFRGGGEYLRRPVRGGSVRKGYLFQASGIWKGREICHLGLRKYPKGLRDEFYGFIHSKKPSIFVIDSYLKDSVFKPVKRDAKF